MHSFNITKSKNYRLPNITKSIINDIISKPIRFDKIRKNTTCRGENFHENLFYMFNGERIYYIDEEPFIKNNLTYCRYTDTNLDKIIFED